MKNMTPETRRFFEVINRIIELRKASTIDEIIKTAKLPNSTISEIKRGKSNPSVRTMQKLVIAYQINLNYIVLGQGTIFANEKTDQPEQKQLAQVSDQAKDREVELLKQIIKTQQDLIDSLKKQIK